MAIKNKFRWFKDHKILTIVIVLAAFGILGAAGSGGSNKSSSSTTKASKNTAKTYRFNERGDKQPADVEVLPNEQATVGGVGLTRLLMNLLGLHNVREVTFLYRGPNRLTP